MQEPKQKLKELQINPKSKSQVKVQIPSQSQLLINILEEGKNYEKVKVKYALLLKQILPKVKLYVSFLYTLVLRFNTKITTLERKPHAHTQAYSAMHLITSLCTRGATLDYKLLRFDLTLSYLHIV